MKSIPKLIAEHNTANLDLEARYEETRDAVIKELTRIAEMRRQFLGFEMRIHDQVAKFQEELAKLQENFDKSSE